MHSQIWPRGDLKTPRPLLACHHHLSPAPARRTALATRRLPRTLPPGHALRSGGGPLAGGLPEVPPVGPGQPEPMPGLVGTGDDEVERAVGERPRGVAG